MTQNTISYGKLLNRAFSLFNVYSVEIAEEIHISESAIRQWERGRNMPSKTYLDPLYKHLSKKIKDSESSSLKAQLAKYVSDLIPDFSNSVIYDREATEDYLISALKYVYAKEKNPATPHSTSFQPTNKTQVVCFDFDGTLTESGATKTTWETIWTELEYDVSECQKLHRRFDRKEISHNEWCRLTAEKFMEKRLPMCVMHRIADGIQLINGCQETFEYLSSKNIKIFIISGSILVIIQRVMKGLLHFIDSIKANDFKFSPTGFLIEIIGTKYDFEGKSDYIREISENLRISPQDILFVGNSYNDRFAYNSGVRTLCINPKHTDPTDSIIWNNCVLECKSLTQILDYVIT